MIVLKCSNISFSFGTNKVLDNATFSLNDTDKAGFVGVNGAGKTTMLNIITGKYKPDNGTLFISKGCKIGYLEQDNGISNENAVLEEILTVFRDLIDTEKKMRELELQISNEKNQVELNALIKQYDAISYNFARNGGYEYMSRAKGVLKGLGFSENQFNLPCGNLSGGQKTRLALAKLLLTEPDLLLLDEPTNHLDISAIEWLEEFLLNYKKSLLIISHDRYFLDSVTNKTIELEGCECTEYTGNYSAFIKKKTETREIQQKHYEQQQKEIARIEAFIEQQKQWNRERNLIAARSRQKVLDRMEKIDKPRQAPDKIKIKFKSGVSSGKDVLFVNSLAKEYPSLLLFKDINFTIRKNERVFLIGPNGCGKSTLLKILAGVLDATAGNVEYGHNVKVGYYDQEQENLNEENTILEEVWNTNEKLTHTQIRDTLALFLFTGEDVFKKVSVLSGGEKSRVALAKLMLSGSNFLLLDEPTNHLDIMSKEALESALKEFDGTILAVSHDRYFINKLGTRIMEMNNSGIIDYFGNYSDYVSYRKNLKLSENSQSQVKLSDSRLEYQKTKEERARQRKLEKRLSDTEADIYLTEKEIESISEKMMDPAIQADHVALTDLYEQKQELANKLNSLYALWSELLAGKLE
ncbi:MAG TPA: ABC-F type ribosomal protection protein [Clostridiaceae bacterium]|nr:ABC-F type ribosomal protection protein [Clostridiaceae bacterium]